jgi:hypothetical protein
MGLPSEDLSRLAERRGGWLGQQPGPDPQTAPDACECASPWCKSCFPEFLRDEPDAKAAA